MERNKIFATISKILIPLSFQPTGLVLRYFKLLFLLDQIFYVWDNKGVRTPSSCKDIRTRKLEFVTKTLFIFFVKNLQFMYLNLLKWRKHDKLKNGKDQY